MKLRRFRIWTMLLGLYLFIACSNASDDFSTIDKSGNLLKTGESANDILSNNTYKNLKIEIAYVTGFRPTQGAIEWLTNYIKRHTFKENIEIVFNELPSSNKETLTIQEVANLETKNRTVYNDGETLGIYIYFVDALFDDENEFISEATLGSVYRNTSMVIHKRTVQKIADRNLIPEAVVETATINHEFGHLLGLVNFGTIAINNHEDTEAKHHCNISGCLMGAELQFSPIGKSSLFKPKKDKLQLSCLLNEKSLLKILEASSAKGFSNIARLDAECILDLQGNGGR